jgi:hypothetical protein
LDAAAGAGLQLMAGQARGLQQTSQILVKNRNAGLTNNEVDLT